MAEHNDGVRKEQTRDREIERLETREKLERERDQRERESPERERERRSGIPEL